MYNKILPINDDYQLNHKLFNCEENNRYSISDVIEEHWIVMVIINREKLDFTIVPIFIKFSIHYIAG